MRFWGILTAKSGKNIQVQKTDIHMLHNISRTGVAHLIQVFHLNIRHKCCGWLNYAHFKQTLNLTSFSSCSGHRLFGGRLFGRRKGTRVRLLLPPQRGQRAESTAGYSHFPGPADHRNIGFISHLHHSLLAPSVAEMLTSSVEKNSTKNTNNVFNLWTQDQSDRHGTAQPVGQFQCWQQSRGPLSSICWHRQQAQPKLIQNYHIHDFHRSFNSV